MNELGWEWTEVTGPVHVVSASPIAVPTADARAESDLSSISHWAELTQQK